MSAGYAEPERKQLSIAKGQGGHYWIAGSINGQPVQFLVDTGATSVAINENQARRLGIDPSTSFFFSVPKKGSAIVLELRNMWSGAETHPTVELIVK